VKEFEERRKYVRVETHMPVRFQLKGFSSKFGHTLSKDISEGGMRLVLNEFLPPKTEVLIEAIVLGKIISTLAKVVWSQRISHSDSYQTGLKFLEMDRTAREKFREYINYKRVS